MDRRNLVFNPFPNNIYGKPERVDEEIVKASVEDSLSSSEITKIKAVPYVEEPDPVIKQASGRNISPNDLNYQNGDNGDTLVHNSSSYSMNDYEEANRRSVDEREWSYDDCNMPDFW